MNSLSQQQMAELAEAFEMFDFDGEGYIEPRDIDNILSSLGSRLPAALLGQMKARKATEGAKISFEELLHLLTHCMTASQYEDTGMAKRSCALREAIAFFDPAGTGEIAADDFRKALRDTMRDTDVDDLIRKADPTDTGLVRYDELVTSMTGC